MKWGTSALRISRWRSPAHALAWPVSAELHGKLYFFFFPFVCIVCAHMCVGMHAVFAWVRGQKNLALTPHPWDRGSHWTWLAVSKHNTRSLAWLFTLALGVPAHACAPSSLVSWTIYLAPLKDIELTFPCTSLAFVRAAICWWMNHAWILCPTQVRRQHQTERDKRMSRWVGLGYWVSPYRYETQGEFLS